MKRKKLISMILIYAFVAMGIYGCGNKASENTTETDAPVNTETTGEEITEPETPAKVSFVGKDFLADSVSIDISGTDLAPYYDTINQSIKQFDNLQIVTMHDCGLTKEQYAHICDSNPDIKFIWTIELSHWTLQTDMVAFGTFKTCDMNYFLYDDEAYYLKYCTDLVALDLGHNRLTNVEFLKYMPNLKVLIIVDNILSIKDASHVDRIKDVSPIKYCTKLEYLEIFCNSIEDISFMGSLPNLVDLNISYNPINNDDVQYLYGHKNLKRLWMEHTWISYSEFEKLKANYPDAEMHFYGTGSIDHNWRSGDNYNAMRNMLENNIIDPIYAD